MPPNDRALNDLSLADLSALAGALVTLETVGRVLDEQGLDPRFDLTPGAAVTIATSFRMPAIGDTTLRASRMTFADQMKEAASAYWRNHYAQADTPSTGGAPDEPALPTATDVAGIMAEIEPAAPSRSDDEAPPPPGVAEASPPPLAEAASPDGVADSGGEDGTGSGDILPAAPSTAGANERSFTGAATWTPEEDARLIALVVMGVARLGLTKGAAMKSAAHELGRAEQGTIFRCHHKLKDRLDAALALGNAYLDQPDDLPAAEPATPSPEATLDPAPADEPGSVHTAAVPAPAKAVADPVTAHLMTLPERGGWTLSRDLHLLELTIAGWQTHEISVELSVSPKDIKARFDALTGLYLDANDKQVRRFARDQVLEALQALQAAHAKAGAA